MVVVLRTLQSDMTSSEGNQTCLTYDNQVNKTEYDLLNIKIILVD